MSRLLPAGTIMVPIGSPLDKRRTRMMRTPRLQVQSHLTCREITLASKQQSHKNKVLFVLGATATGKTKLSIDLARHFNSEIINADKMQVYKGLDILGNKVPEEERQGIPHHLLGFVDNFDEDYTPQEFCNHVHIAMDHILGKGRIPIVVGGSNGYIEMLVNNPSFDFKANFDASFIWIDVALKVLYRRIVKRVDEMMDAGVVDEVREVFVPGKDYGRGIWRTIGVEELEPFFIVERTNSADEATKKMLLDSAVEDIKRNTCKLAENQIGKIKRLRDELGWKLHRIDATPVFEEHGGVCMDMWMKAVLTPSLEICSAFLKGESEEDGDYGAQFLASRNPALQYK
ncbi:hypothetical protein Tsubulata_009840 [Turnera subulata]|uniref:adenylate dimethylallyltransferase (ADP/ATP-dependent) n=1 Tax=Turnera subulata TaxID=218843 RepID=A0A9Q0FIJ6_9ROSI|nr:hypothetical protein Tsubulata_009840 [Turnera subulata]